MTREQEYLDGVRAIAAILQSSGEFIQVQHLRNNNWFVFTSGFEQILIGMDDDGVFWTNNFDLRVRDGGYYEAV